MPSAESLLDTLRQATDEAASLAEDNADFDDVRESLETLQAQVQSLIDEVPA